MSKLPEVVEDWSLVCHSPWGHKESETTQRLKTTSPVSLRVQGPWEIFAKNCGQRPNIFLITPEKGRAQGHRLIKILRPDDKTFLLATMNHYIRRHMFNHSRELGNNGMFQNLFRSL